MKRSEEVRCPDCGDYTRISFEEGTEPPGDKWEFVCPNCSFPLAMRLEKEIKDNG